MTFLFLIVLIIVLLAVGGAVIGALSHVIWWILAGLVIGALARFLVKGTQGLGLLRTTLAGIAGSLGGGLLAHAMNVDGGATEFLIAILVAAVVIGVLVGAIGGRGRPRRV